MKKPFKTLWIGLLAVVFALSLFLCACGDKKPPTPTTYTVTYNLGGGQGTTPNGGSYEEGKTFTLAAATGFNRDGYTFDKWNDGTADYAAGATYTMPAKNVTFTAKWTEDEPVTPPEKETFTVIFDMNGHGVPIAPKSAQEGETVAEPEAPAALFFTFGGWYEDAACTKAFDFGAPLTANATVYAKWTPNEDMPETGYLPDAPTRLVLNGVALADDIANGTTLYYTFTATAAGRYGFSIESDDVAKLDYLYTVSLSADDELNANFGLVGTNNSFYLTLQADETVSISVTVKDGETISVENPSSVRVSVFDVTDEPVPEGTFKEGTYNGQYAGYMPVVFKITNRANKAFSLNVNDNGVSTGTFTYLDGKGYISQSWATSSNWFLGWGTLEWIPGEDENEPAQINFVLGQSGTAPILLTEEFESVTATRENWIGEYECDSDASQIVRVGQKFVQVIAGDDIEIFFQSSSSATAQISLGSTGAARSVKLVTVDNDHVKRIKVTFADGSVLRYTLKSKDVIEVPVGLPLITDAEYYTEDESANIHTNSSGYTYTKIDGTNIRVYVLDYDGVKYTVSIDNKVYFIKIVYAANSKAIDKVELYDGDTLVRTYDKTPIDVADHIYEIASGANTVTVHAQTGYAYITVPETKCYTFSGNVAIYGGVVLAKPDADGEWTPVQLNKKMNLTVGTLLAVKALNGNTTFSFDVLVQPILGTDPSNPIEINGNVYTYDSAIAVDQKVYVRFVAPVAGEYTFSSADSATSSLSNYGGIKIYKVSKNGTIEEVEIYVGKDEENAPANASQTYTLAAGDYIEFYMFITGTTPRSNRTVKVEQTLELGEATALTGESGTLTETGSYNANELPDGVIGIVFTAKNGEIILVLPNGATKTGTSVEALKAELETENGVYLIFDGEVDYAYHWTLGYEKNPYKINSFTLGSRVENEHGQVYVQFTAPVDGVYRFSAGEWNIAQVTDGQEGEAVAYLTLELSADDVITLLLTKDGETSTSFVAQLDFSNNALDVSFTTDSIEGEFTDNTNYKIAEEITYDVEDVKITAKADDATLTVSFATGEVYTGHEITVPVRVIVAGVCFRVEGGDAAWKVNYTLGSLNNPYVVTEPTRKYQQYVSAGKPYYVKVTAPEFSDLWIAGRRGETIYQSRFQIAGDATGTYYGYSNYGSTNTTYAKGCILAAGETAIYKVDFSSATYSNWAALGIWYSWQEDNLTAIDVDAENKTLDGAHVYTMPVTVGKIQIKSTDAFEVISVQEYSYTDYVSTWTSTTASLSDDDDGYYYATVTVSTSSYNNIYVNFTGESTSATYEVAEWATGTADNPQQLTAMTTKLGNTSSISYKRCFENGYYYASVELPIAGSYNLKSNNTSYSVYDSEGNTSADGVVFDVTADNLTLTFKVKINTWTEADLTNTSVTTFTVAITLVSDATLLEFKQGEGVDYKDVGKCKFNFTAGTLYTIGDIIVSEDLDKSLTSSPIRIESDKLFSIVYADGTTGSNASLSNGVYFMNLTKTNAQRKFAIINATSDVTCSVNWAEGSYYNPQKYSTYAAGTSYSYSYGTTAYILVSNDTANNWLLTVTKSGTTLGLSFAEKWTDNIHEASEDTKTYTQGVVIPAGETWLIKIVGRGVTNLSSMTVTIVNDFSTGIEELTLAEETMSVTNTFVSGKTYKLADDCDPDIAGIVFSDGVKITLANGTVITNGGITQTQAKAGFLVEFEGSATATFIWHTDSAKAPKALALGENSVAFHADTMSVATFTADKDGWYAITLSAASTGYKFQVNGGEWITTRRSELQFRTGDKITFVFASTATAPKDGTVVLTFEYGEEQKYTGFTADMVGKWTGSISIFDPVWGNSTITVELTIKEDGTVAYYIRHSNAGAPNNITPTTPMSLEFWQEADGTFTATYKQSNNTRTVTITVDENGALSVKDSNYSGGQFVPLTKSAA